MVEPGDAKELIEEAIDRAESRQGRQDAAEHAIETAFRNRVSFLVGLFAVLLAVIHVVAADTQRESILRNIEASDDFSYMQAKIIRETVLLTAAGMPGATPAEREKIRAEAARLRAPDRAGHGIGQLQQAGEDAREEGRLSAAKANRYDYGETALQIAIVLLSIALIARSWLIVAGASALAALGVLAAALATL